MRKLCELVHEWRNLDPWTRWGMVLFALYILWSAFREVD